MIFAEKKRVLVPLAPGFEELEAIAPIDLLRRAGAHVVTASVDAQNPITGRNRLRFMADIDLPEALDEWGDRWDLVLLPGGPAVAKLEQSEALIGLLRRRLAAGELTAAICAAPRLLALAGLAPATRFTCYPTEREALSAYENYTPEPVVVDGAIITGRGPGAAPAFGLACVEALFGAEVADRIREEAVLA